MEIAMSTHGSTLAANLSGNFTFSDNQKFKSIIAEMKQGKDLKSVELNFSGVSFVDSAALGMILVLREDANKLGIGVTLRGATGQVEKMFTLSRFEQLFTLAS